MCPRRGYLRGRSRNGMACHLPRLPLNRAHLCVLTTKIFVIQARNKCTSEGSQKGWLTERVSWSPRGQLTLSWMSSRNWLLITCIKAQPRGRASRNTTKRNAFATDRLDCQGYSVRRLGLFAFIYDRSCTHGPWWLPSRTISIIHGPFASASGVPEIRG